MKSFLLLQLHPAMYENPIGRLRREVECSLTRWGKIRDKRYIIVENMEKAGVEVEEHQLVLRVEHSVEDKSVTQIN